jgi:hypothetical protein
MSIVTQTAVGKAGILGRTRQVNRLTDSDSATPRGVLDDDPAILADSSEEWIEHSTSIAIPASGEFNCGTLPVTRHQVNLIIAPAPRDATLIDLLCSYQC